jgi:hypothetical protein
MTVDNDHETYTKVIWRDSPSSLIYRLSELPIMMCDGTKAEQNEWEGKAGVRRRVDGGI